MRGGLMPAYSEPRGLMARMGALERQVSELRRRRAQPLVDVPFFPVSAQTMPYQSYTGWTTAWEAVVAPRGEALHVGLAMIGDRVSSTDTGGEWQVLVNGSLQASGFVDPIFSLQYASVVLVLSGLVGLPEVTVSVQTRRTSGAPTGGKHGAGGSIGIAPTWARLM
jgi:hypothetical protein